MSTNVNYQSSKTSISSSLADVSEIIPVAAPRTKHASQKKNKFVKKKAVVVSENQSVASETPTERVMEDVNKTSDDEEKEVVFNSLADFERFNEMSGIVKDNLNKSSKGKILLTKKEKGCLEEITHLTSKLRAPLDDRHMLRYKKDLEKMSTKIILPESEVTAEELKEAVPNIGKTMQQNLTATEVLDLAAYLNDLKSLIARRELAWANSREIDYAQKTEIGRLRNEVSHLRVVANKKDSDIEEKIKLIAEKDEEIDKLQKLVQRLKLSIIEQAKKQSVMEEEKPSTSSRGKSKKLIEDLLAKKNDQGDQKTNKEEIVKNRGPVALLANALYNARIAGNIN